MDIETFSILDNIGFVGLGNLRAGTLLDELVVLKFIRGIDKMGLGQVIINELAHVILRYLSHLGLLVFYFVVFHVDYYQYRHQEQWQQNSQHDDDRVVIMCGGGSGGVGGVVRGHGVGLNYGHNGR